jgi:hypothetical protein
MYDSAPGGQITRLGVVAQVFDHNVSNPIRRHPGTNTANFLEGFSVGVEVINNSHDVASA